MDICKSLGIENIDMYVPGTNLIVMDSQARTAPASKPPGQPTYMYLDTNEPTSPIHGTRQRHEEAYQQLCIR